MASPGYTNDLTTIATGDEDPGATNWTVFSTNEQGSPAGEDPEYPFIQGLQAMTQTCSKSKTLGNMGFDYGSAITLPPDGAFLVWQLFASPFVLDDYAGSQTTYGGMHILIGANTSNFGWWDVGGKDINPNPYGGFFCHAVNTTVDFDRQTGTYAGDQVVGAGVALTGYPSKGEPHSIDVMRFGRCSAIFAGGESNDPCTFYGFSLRNDEQYARWGLIQATPGGYLWQGRMQIGDTPAASACRFDDENTTIFVRWTPKVTRRFNMIEVININSYVDWDGIVFQVLDLTTNSRGWFKMTDPATLYWSNCSFTDFDRFIFYASGSNPVEITSCNFTRCGTISQNFATFDGCTISDSTSAIALSANDLDLISNCDFISNGVSGHAIEIASNALELINTSSSGSAGYTSVYSDGKYVYVTALTEGITSFDVDRKGKLTNLFTNYRGPGWYRRLWGDGNHIYVSCENDGVRSYSVSADGTLKFKDRNDQGGTHRGMYADSNFIYAACLTAGLRTYTVAKNGSGKLTFKDSDFQGGDGYENVHGDGNFIYVTCGAGGLRSYSVDGSGVLTYIDQDKQGSNDYEACYAAGGFVYVACSLDGLRVYSVDGSGNLTYLGVDKQGSNAYEWVWGDGDFIYAACSLDGLRSYSVDDSGNLTFLKVIDYGTGHNDGVHGDGKYVYTACDTQGLRSVYPQTKISFDFVGNTFTDYVSANGSTGNEAIYNDTGLDININLINTTSIPSVRNIVGSSTTLQLTTTLTLSGVVSGSEVRIQQARGVNPSGAELFHVENATGADIEWQYNFADYGAGYLIDIIVHNVTYEHLRIDDVTLPNSDTTIPIQQETDRWYANP